MSADRELLELAAKAAGFVITGWNRQRGEDVAVLSDGSYWQPLLKNGITDCDGDALRLAMKLRLAIDHNHPADQQPWVVAERQGCEGCYAPVACIEDDFDEGLRGDGTRRAIVRAAAEIGRAMP